MVITSMRAGLGNQLFEYAIGRRLAAARGVPLKLELAYFRTAQDFPGLEMYNRNYRLHAFNIVAEIATREEVERFSPRPLHRFDPRRLRGVHRQFLRRFATQRCRGLRIYEQNLSFEPGLLRLPGDVHLQGWWQCEGYFRDIAALLRTELTLRDPAITARATTSIESRRRGHRPLVAVQVRRGDVAYAHEVLKDLQHMPYELVSQEYLRDAMAVFGDNARFLVFSETDDDIAWCRANLQARDIGFISGQGDLHDFVAMSLCDHNIISNSSFGWWTAWLNRNPDKTVVAPRRWFRPGCSSTFNIHDLIPSQWLLR